MTRYLLDTNVISHLVEVPAGAAAKRINALPRASVCTSIFVAAEIHLGLAKRRSASLAERVQLVLGAIRILPVEPPVEEVYGEVRAVLERAGTPIGANDLLIAAHALALDCTLITANEREFARVPGLRVENWLA